MGALVLRVEPNVPLRPGAVEPRAGAAPPRENPPEDAAVTDAGGAKEYGGGAEVVDVAVEDVVEPPPKGNPLAVAGANAVLAPPARECSEFSFSHASDSTARYKTHTHNALMRNATLTLS